MELEGAIAKKVNPADSFLSGERLSLYASYEIGRNMRQEDRVDCWRHGEEGINALLTARLAGPSWAVRDMGSGKLIGAVGWNWPNLPTTEMGNIWSLWCTLSDHQKREIMRLTPSVVMAFSSQADRRPLGNYVWEGNRETRAWLRASHCFNFLDTTATINDKTFLPFVVKPWEELCAIR